MAYNDGYKGRKDSVKAWANFNQTSTQAIRDSYNVSSITDSGTGASTINFSKALSSADYSAVASGPNTSGLSINYSIGVGSFATTSVAVYREASDGTAYDGTYMNLIVFGS